jgi:hypothetical protein
MAKNAVATKKEQAVALSEWDAEIEADAETYQEALSKDDMAIPFIAILQQLSPQLEETDAAYIEGAKQGMIANSVTKELYDRDVGMLFVPISYSRSFIEWITRAKGGGIVKEWSVEEGSQILVQRNDSGQDIITEQSEFGTPGNQLNDTHTHIIFAINEATGTWAPAVMTMASTQIKYSKQLNTGIDGMKTASGLAKPRFQQLFRAKTTLRSNDQGKWYVWAFDREGGPEGVQALDYGLDLYRAAKTFKASLEAGERTVDHAANVASTESKTSGSTDDMDEEIPF